MTADGARAEDAYSHAVGCPVGGLGGYTANFDKLAPDRNWPYDPIATVREVEACRLAGMRNQKKLIAWFVTFAVLTAVDQFPYAVLVGSIATFGWLAWLATAPTILLYSTLLLPALIVGVRPGKLWRYGAALALVALVALGPGQLSRMAVEASWRQMSRNDFTSNVTGQPRTIEIADDSAFGECKEICLRLLFNREVEQVRISSYPQRSVAYHIERRESCPDVNVSVVKAIRDRLVAGECLIRIVGAREPSDAVVSLTRLSETIRKLTIEQRQLDGKTAQILQLTELRAQVIAQPFYFGYVFPDIKSGMGYAGIAIARRPFSKNPIDLAQTMRSVFAFKVAPVDQTRPEDGKEVAKRVLALTAETSPMFSSQQLSAISEAVMGLSVQDSLSDADIELISRVVRDRRVNREELVRGRSPIESLFEKHIAQLAATVPLVLIRLGSPETSGFGSFQWALDRAFMHYPAEVLRSNSQSIFELVEKRPGGPTEGLLSRAAEMDGDASGVIAKYLDGESLALRSPVSQSVAQPRRTGKSWSRSRSRISIRRHELVGRPAPRITGCCWPWLGSARKMLR
jgi:hypothetical protein